MGAAARGDRKAGAAPRQGAFRTGPREPGRLWPRLTLISCWTDARAAPAAEELARRFPGVTIQAKGLVATEAFVSLPYERRRPVAITSHFFEFLDSDGRAHLANELRDGGEYEVLVTTGAGLYRYRLGDRVRVTGFVGATPSLEFVGREDRVSDRRGEKLNDAHVGTVLCELLKPLDLGVRFAMLAPDPWPGGIGYTLYLEADSEPPPMLATRLDSKLAENPHYRYCRELGQLAAVRLFLVDSDARRSVHARGHGSRSPPRRDQGGGAERGKRMERAIPRPLFGCRPGRSRPGLHG